MSWRRSPHANAEERRTDAQAALTAATALLARRDFPSSELHEKLRAKAFDEDTAAAVIANLTRQGALNDERYAQNYVAYHAGRGQGPIRIAAELRRRGLAAEVVDAALAGGADWRVLAAKVCRAKFGPEPPASWALKARQARFLQYRGFSSDHIRAATGADSDSGLTDL
jgi:regulatory protein